MSLLPFFQWCYDTPLGETIRTSTFLFPVIEALHLLAFGVTVGAVLVVNLRLLGTGLRKEPAAQLWAGARPWLIGGVIVMFASGIPLFLSEAIKCYYSFPFWVKMTSLLLAILFTFAIVRRVARADKPSNRPLPATVTAIVSLVLWFGVAWGGRWIGFSG
ncbi:MAG TPA: DUF6644 family protein [Xanthobacteraceae bacterium]|jgi:uncharacterized membrane protein SirB2